VSVYFFSIPPHGMRRILSRSFVDAVRVTVTAGKGGDGFVSFRKEAFVALGGPDGGHGGHGGDVLIQTDPTLTDLRHLKPRLRAQDGVDGKRKQRDGRKGADLLLAVPVGTSVLDAYSGECLHDLDAPMPEPLLLLRGGDGGKGNRAFKTPVMQGPRIRTLGAAGPSKVLDLVLKSIADIGLVGYPNAGKSTLLRAISRSKTEVGNYPFTTLQPHIGHVTLPFAGAETFTVADLPGLIEEAHLNKGLGFQFLRHVERTKGLVYVIDVNPGYKRFNVADPGVAPVDVHRILHRELELYQPGLTDRALMVLLNKVDAADPADVHALKEEMAAASGLPVYLVSAKEAVGLEEPLRILHDYVRRKKKEAAALRALPEPTDPPSNADAPAGG